MPFVLCLFTGYVQTVFSPSRRDNVLHFGSPNPVGRQRAFPCRQPADFDTRPSFALTLASAFSFLHLAAIERASRPLSRFRVACAHAVLSYRRVPIALLCSFVSADPEDENKCVRYLNLLYDSAFSGEGQLRAALEQSSLRVRGQTRRAFTGSRMSNCTF